MVYAAWNNDGHEMLVWVPRKYKNDPRPVIGYVTGFRSYNFEQIVGPSRSQTQEAKANTTELVAL